MDCKGIITQRLEEHQELMSRILADASLQQKMAEIVKALTACFRNGGKVYFCGNGGSAADAQHLAAEFSGKFYIDRPVLPAEALHCNTSYLTAVSNDYSFDIVYARMIEGVGKPGDVFIGLSTSGNSVNILHALDACKAREITSVAFTGETGGKLQGKTDYLINVPSSDTPRVQEAHMTIGHIICELVEEAIFGKR